MNRKSFALALSAFVFLSAGTVFAVRWTLFGKPEIYPTGAAPLDVVISDFNQDSHLDVATANRDGRSVSIFAGNGDGTLTEIAQVSLPGGGTSLAAADMNLDGIVDLVVSSCHEHCNGSEVLILTGQGDGQFFITSQTDLQGVAYNILAVDLNGDLLPDIAASDYPGDRIYILTQQTAGIFAVSELPTGHKPIALVSTDLNADTRADLISSDHAAGSSSVYLAVDGGFADRLEVGTGTLPYSIKATDFDNDGTVDLAVAHSSDPALISLLRGNGDGSFALAESIRVDDRLVYIDSADFNNDGLLDVIVTRHQKSYASVYLNQGNFKFLQRGIPVQAHNKVYSLAVGDLDSDGLPDLVTVDYEASTLSVSLGGKLDETEGLEDPAYK